MLEDIYNKSGLKPKVPFQKLKEDFDDSNPKFISNINDVLNGGYLYNNQTKLHGIQKSAMNVSIRNYERTI